MPELVVPTVALQASFLEAMAEFAAEGRAGDGSGLGRDIEDWTGRWETAEGFAAYVAEKVAERTEVTDPRWVLCTNLWWVDRGEYVGRMSIRHELNEGLREVGGHIGYNVRRSRRRQGHATAMLRAALPVAREVGVDPALLTCDPDNVGSRKVIENAGGVYESERNGKLRYWVPTS